MSESDRRLPGQGAQPQEQQQADAQPGSESWRMQIARQRRALQRKAGSSEGQVDSEGAHAVAEAGMEGNAGSLPHLDKIQRAFGEHDVRGVKAFSGGAAEAANAKLGSMAYAKGDNVALGAGPDLHTVAHEAAHIIQQRSGVDLAGGMGAKGDRYERHADEVAERVVQGRSAESVLDKMTSGKRGGGGMRAGLQLRAGSTDGVKVDERLGMGKNVDYKTALGGVKRDKNLNNEKKQGFENHLIEAIMKSGDAFRGAVFTVSQRMLGYLEERKKLLGTEVKSSLEAIISKEPKTAYGRMVDDVADKTAVSEGATQLETMLKDGGGPIQQHLTAQSFFLEAIYKKDTEVKKQQGDQMATIAKQILDAKRAQSPEAGGFDGQNMEADALKKESMKVNLGTADGGSVESTPYGDRGRSKQPGGNTDSVQGVSGAGPRPDAAPTSAEPSAKPAEGAPAPLAQPEAKDDGSQEGAQSHQRGTDIWTAQESNVFVQHARLVIDMPVSGAGVSGTAADMMTTAMVMGVTGLEDKKEYALACFAHLGGAGAHSFHEVMTMLAQVGIPYTPGSYAGIYPKDFLASAAAKELMDMDPDYVEFLTGKPKEEESTDDESETT